MAINITTGDILKQDVDAVINTVNCVGVMGKGIALQFKRKYPENFKAYEAACRSGLVQIGKMFVYDLGFFFQEKPRFIINFPTKKHWKEKSEISYIEDGLKDLIKIIRELKIKSIAIPPLGCGNGGLEWHKVKHLIMESLQPLNEQVEMFLFNQQGAPNPLLMETRTVKPEMTIGRAVLIKLISLYRHSEDFLSQLEIQKLCYFAQEAGESLRLNYVKNKYGPYANNLKYVLDRIEGHYLQGVGDYDTSFSRIILMPGALDESDKFLQDNPDRSSRIAKVTKVIEGFEDPYGMELLSTVHWVCSKTPKAQTLQEVVDAIYNWQHDQPQWNQRKQAIMQEKHIKVAWEHLSRSGWINT
jgi:O-acetyl-ADP-ribose deacetylase (regulator of RNase III)